MGIDLLNDHTSKSKPINLLEDEIGERSIMGVIATLDYMFDRFDAIRPDDSVDEATRRAFEEKECQVSVRIMSLCKQFHLPIWDLPKPDRESPVAKHIDEAMDKFLQGEPLVMDMPI